MPSYILNNGFFNACLFCSLSLNSQIGLIFWGNQHNVNKVLIFQKRILTIMLGLGCRSSCRAWFKQLDILTIPCLYIYSVVMFVICNSSYFKTNFSVHSIHTRQKNNFHKPLVKFTLIQRGITYSPIRVFNKLPLEVTQFQHDKMQFKNALKKYLIMFCILRMNF